MENEKIEKKRKDEKQERERERDPADNLWCVCGGISTIMSYMLCYHIHRLVKYCTHFGLCTISNFGDGFMKKKLFKEIHFISR